MTGAANCLVTGRGALARPPQSRSLSRVGAEPALPAAEQPSLGWAGPNEPPPRYTLTLTADGSSRSFFLFPPKGRFRPRRGAGWQMPKNVRFLFIRALCAGLRPRTFLALLTPPRAPLTCSLTDPGHELCGSWGSRQEAASRSPPPAGNSQQRRRRTGKKCFKKTMFKKTRSLLERNWNYEYFCMGNALERDANV